MIRPENRIALVMLLGRRDDPTDGVEDYCFFLAEALRQRGVSVELMRVPWVQRGWLSAFLWLWKESAQWQGRWVLVQYTALGWSRRGFPLGLLLVLFLLRYRNLSIAVVFHDAAAYPGTRWVDRARRTIQQFVMRKTAAQAERVILPASSEQLTWLKSQRRKTVFIPVGSNIPPPPERDKQMETRATTQYESKIVAVFGITPGERGKQEMTDIREAMKAAARCAPHVQLCAFGRGTMEAEPILRRFFDGTGVEVSVLGLLPAAQIGEILSRADVQVHVRNQISSQRGSVVAGIVCGTPIVGFDAAESDAAIREAGVVLVPPGDIKALTAAVTRVLSDDLFRQQLCLRNQIASQKCFSWDAISHQLLRALLTGSIDGN
jgi:glycosyltransferase involved in cell wall biosynthesis